MIFYMTRFKLIGLGLLGVASLSFAIGIGVQRYLNFGTPPSSPVAIESGYVLSEPRPLQPFELIDHNGEAFDRDAMLGRWTFLFFGYTHCPDVCPATLAQMAEVYKSLHERGLAQHTGVVFATVDPERDTPQRLGEYVPYFNPDFLGVSGASEQIQRLAAQVGVLYMKVENEQDPTHYLVDHSTSILLLDPRARLVAVLTAPHQFTGLIQDFERIRDHFEHG